MSGTRRGLVVVVGLWALACSGLSVDPATVLKPACDLGTLSIGAPLPTADLPPKSVGEVAVQLTVGGARVGWRRVDGPGLADALREQAEQQRALGRKPDSLSVAIAADVPVERVRELLQGAHDAGFTELRVGLWTSRSVELPPYVDPAYGAEVQAKLAEAPPNQRQMHAAMEMEGLVTACPPAKRAFEAVAVASPDLRCVLFAKGLEEALPSCPLTDGDKVLTLTQVLVQPAPGEVPTEVRLRITPLTEPPVQAEAGATWGSVIDQVVALEGKRFWL